MLSSLDVPAKFNRNSKGVGEVGFEETAVKSLEYAAKCFDLNSYASSDILDIGCGVRFTMTIINRSIPIKSYTGIDVYKPMVEFLQQDVAAKDSRFQYHHWDVHNAAYNKSGVPLVEHKSFPTKKKFDIIWGWSLFTHLNPEDSQIILELARKSSKKNGKLFFTAFIEDGVDDFEDRDPEHPMRYAFYSRDYMRELTTNAGWKIEFERPKDMSVWAQHHFICSPA